MERTLHLDLLGVDGRVIARSQSARLVLDPVPKEIEPQPLWRGLLEISSEELRARLAHDPHASKRLHARTRDGRDVGLIVFQEYFSPVPGRELGSARFEFRGELP